MSFATRFKQRREELGLTQMEVAEKLGITKGAVGNYETQVSSPKAEILYKIFSILQCDANFLFQDEIKHLTLQTDITNQEKEFLYKYRQLDAYGQEILSFLLEKEWQRAKQERAARQTGNLVRLDFYDLPVSAGTGQSLTGEYKTYLEVSSDKVPYGTDFVLRVSGDSMEPEFYDGDIVCIKSQQTLEQEEIGVFIVNGEGYLKKLGYRKLVSLNRRYAPIPLLESDSVYCVGKVLGKLQKNPPAFRSRKTALKAVARSHNDDKQLEIDSFHPDRLPGLQKGDDF